MKKTVIAAGVASLCLLVGVSFPGVPLVVIGHNDYVAWGVTNSAADVQDVYIEQLNEAKDSYLDKDGWKPLLKREETIRVRGRSEPEKLEFLWTSRGPILSPFIIKNGVPVSLRSTIYEGGQIFESLFRLNKARNWGEFCQAAALWDVPSQNIVYADVNGNIGYYLSGLVPLRKKAAALFPAPGWIAENGWQGFLEEAKKPLILNPEKGYIVTANNKIVPDDYPYYISCDFDVPFRAGRIEELLLKQEKHTYPHALGRVPLLRFFNRGPYPLSGDTFCIRASLSDDVLGNFATTWGVSYRQIIDLSDFRNSVCVLSSGQSGHLLSRHYDDQMQLWLKGAYRPMLFILRISKPMPRPFFGSRLLQTENKRKA
jgi:acyl-homoserine lactone acylase PvdQ